MSSTFSKHSILLWVLMFLSLTLSCKKPTVTSYSDVDAIKDYIYTHPSIFSADVFDTSSTDPDFYRQITKRDNWIKIDFYESDSFFTKYAYVNWDDSILGFFHTFISGQEYTRNIKAFSRVKAYFEQWGNSGDVYRGWLLMKVSNLLTYSTQNYVGFNSVRVTYSGSTQTVAPNSLYDIGNVLQFPKNSEVSFSIDVSDVSDFYYLHIYEGGSWRKIPFQKVSSNEFKAVWTTSSQDLNTYKHAYIDCIDSLSVNKPDTTQKYDSETWGIMYQIINP